MFTKEQEKLLEHFANANDKLFELGITTTDSFTGEIGEFVACRHFQLQKSKRVTRAIDGICESGNKYQIKSKVLLRNNFNYNITKLDSAAFEYLAVVFFDRSYTPIKILRIPSSMIKDGQISINTSFLKSDIEVFDKDEIEILSIEREAIDEFAEAYNKLQENKLIRSRRIVGDIGELYACTRLGLELSENLTEKGIDARHACGLTFEIKTRRVYESKRRSSDNRRLNNLVGKTADFLIVVTLDRCFKCAGMWLIPMKNLINPKSANLKIVNSTAGTRNLIPSQINWLNTGKEFKTFDCKEKESIALPPQKKVARPIVTQSGHNNNNNRKPRGVFQEPIKNPDRGGCFSWFFLIAIIYLIWLFTN